MTLLIDINGSKDLFEKLILRGLRPRKSTFQAAAKSGVLISTPLFCHG
jgi:hypothetical protein